MVIWHELKKAYEIKCKITPALVRHVLQHVWKSLCDGYALHTEAARVSSLHQLAVDAYEEQASALPLR